MKQDSENKQKKVREFKLSTMAISNRSTVVLMAIMLVIFGLTAYNTMPLEFFPEVVFPKVFVKTVYPGNAPVDMENLITRPLEKEIKGIKGIKVMKSTSSQDNSDIIIDFHTGINLDKALNDVKDAVDKAKSELPNDLDMDPVVEEMDVNEFPIININISGDFSITELKKYAEYLEDEIELLSQITRVDIKGLNEREIQINADPYKMAAKKVSFNNIETAVADENVSISGGDVKVAGTSRSIRTVGEFSRVDELERIIVKRYKGNIVYLNEIASIEDGFEEPLTYARLDLKPVVSLQVVKKSGENLIHATDGIFNILAQAKRDGMIPKELKISITGDQSDDVKKMVDNLENSIIMGVIFVVLVLFFFLGIKNAVFVGVAIPMSMTISFVVLSIMGSTINIMVLFGMVLALGMLVDNAIVVVENIYRFMGSGKKIFDAAKEAVGEIAIPIIASTATTLAAFLPMVFWPGLVGEFMKHLPVTLIIVLSASLFVALVIIPVIFLNFTDPEKPVNGKPKKKKTLKLSMIFGAISLFFYMVGMIIPGSLMLVTVLLLLLNQFFFYNLAEKFQKDYLSRLEEFYLKLLKACLKGRRPAMLMVGTFFLLIFVIVFVGVRQPKVEMFPANEPKLINIFAELPVGTDIVATNEFMKKLENRVIGLVKEDSRIVESVLTTVGKGVIGQNEAPIGNTPFKGMVTVNFIDYEFRKGVNTSTIMRKLSDDLSGRYPGVYITVEKDNNGPPTGKPINLEIIGKDFNKLLDIAEDVRKTIEAAHIPGIQLLRKDVDIDKPEMLVKIDRDKARRFGLSTAQVASTIRTALFGKEVSDYKDGEDEYKIQLRLARKDRHDVAVLFNQPVTFQNQNSGKFIQIPISAVADYEMGTTFGTVKRKDMDRVITLYSNVVEGYNAEEINQSLKKIMRAYDMPKGFVYKFTGEQEDQQETVEFLQQAMIIAIASIMLILVTQFNSVSKPFIIIASVFFSTIGVFGGIGIFKMNFVIVMTGIGIISLAGVVVNNAIVLIDYIDYLKGNRKKELGLEPEDNLPVTDIVDCIVQGGKTRLRPVLLTAITTILGLFPMASGMNIDFAGLLSEFNPNIYFGGDNASFWGPMAWTVIFGLTFATFLTLVIVPVMYLIGNRIKLRFLARKGKYDKEQLAG